ncbi:hypothetical protein HP439_18000 [Sphingobacterium shayense]|uniref:hypothetical protein n=1 Tax=Sphingobacterium shayense TaxID=626343 RepID=UPI001557A76D|nr:hypothetical protein [Sphingobacterium shayense]NQD72622.1 hypothetical protein [Sphingobacterium shayense]
MMLKYIAFLFFLVSIMEDEGVLQKLRSNYAQSVKSEETCKAQLRTVEAVSNPSPLELAYIGAYHAVWASHTKAPFDKLKSFKKGKKALENAVRQDPQNAEIRFLRLTIQYNAPNILKYRNEIPDDLEIILRNYDQIEPEKVKLMVKDFLLGTNLLSQPQINDL